MRHSPLAQTQVAPAPQMLPPLDVGAMSQLGLVGVLAFLVIRVFLKQHTDQQNDSWKLLENLVHTQQDTLKTLAVTNQELTLRLARVHERLEHLERLIVGKHDQASDRSSHRQD